MSPPCIQSASCFGSLLAQYTGTEFHMHLEEITRSYEATRAVRRDGNCFYSAALFLLLEFSLGSAEKHVYIREGFFRAHAALARHFDAYIAEEFFEPLRDFFERGRRSEQSVDGSIDGSVNGSLETLDDLFWSYSVVYMRMLTSAAVQESQEIHGFLEEDARVYAKKNIEANCVYAGDIEISALAERLGVQLEIISMETSCMQTYKRGKGPLVGSLLYIPEHFDIIYPKARRP